MNSAMHGKDPPAGCACFKFCAVSRLRGLRTMHLRVKEAEARGLAIAQWLRQRPEVSRVLHPALAEFPGHALWKRDFSGSTGLFSIILQPQYDAGPCPNAGPDADLQPGIFLGRV